MKIYISGKMSGVPNFNFPAFDAAASLLRLQGHEVFNPAEKDRDRLGVDFGQKFDGNLQKAMKNGFSLRDALALDCEWICKQADAIYMLKGWEDSGGARAEHALAHALRLEFIYE